MVKRYLLGTLTVVKAVWYGAVGLGLPKRSVHKGVPYFAQWESRGLVRQILDGTVRAEDDPAWKHSGAATRAEYAEWSWNACGMACLRMVLAHRGQIVPLVTLCKMAVRYGCYDMPLESSIGLNYAPFVPFVREEFGLMARAVPVLPPVQIVYELARGNYVIASVSPAIRDPESVPQAKGGHLVLVVGYDRGTAVFYMHNPSGGSVESQAYAAVGGKDFARFYSGRGIVIAG
ncbi:MAG TPA: C39 family peptidase [Candidatus Saccharimonadales bacterium]|nr:C39 family peptidase [Candidatus Saccharimonadales bacterium]